MHYSCRFASHDAKFKLQSGINTSMRLFLLSFAGLSPAGGLLGQHRLVGHHQAVRHNTVQTDLDGAGVLPGRAVGRVPSAASARLHGVADRDCPLVGAWPVLSAGERTRARSDPVLLDAGHHVRPQRSQTGCEAGRSRTSPAAAVHGEGFALDTAGVSRARPEGGAIVEAGSEGGHLGLLDHFVGDFQSGEAIDRAGRKAIHCQWASVATTSRVRGYQGDLSVHVQWMVGRS